MDGRSRDVRVLDGGRFRRQPRYRMALRHEPEALRHCLATVLPIGTTTCRLVARLRYFTRYHGAMLFDAREWVNTEMTDGTFRQRFGKTRAGVHVVVITTLRARRPSALDVVRAYRRTAMRSHDTGALERNRSRYVFQNARLDDLDAEVVQTLEQPADGAQSRAAVEVSWPEVLVRSTATEHVVGGAQHRCGHGDDRFIAPRRALSRWKRARR